MKSVRRGAAAVVLGLGLLLVPNAQGAPTVISLVAVDETTAVDFGDGVVVVLALGSDSRSADPLEGNADAIELIAIDFETGATAAIGIPRDTLVDVDGYQESKINSGLLVGGPDLMATEVEQLTGVKPHYVVTTGLGGFQALVDTIGTVTINSDVEFSDSEYDLAVEKGPNEMDGLEATGYARSRSLPGSDFDRMANQQGLLRAILVRLRDHEGDEGFMESGALAALQHLDTNLSPRDLYRFAQAISQLDPGQTTTCVLTGPSDDVEGIGNVILLDPAQAQRVAADAADNAVIESGCSG